MKLLYVILLVSLTSLFACKTIQTIEESAVVIIKEFASEQNYVMNYTFSKGRITENKIRISRENKSLEINESFKYNSANQLVEFDKQVSEGILKTFLNWEDKTLFMISPNNLKKTTKITNNSPGVFLGKGTFKDRNMEYFTIEYYYYDNNKKVTFRLLPFDGSFDDSYQKENEIIYKRNGATIGKFEYIDTSDEDIIHVYGYVNNLFVRTYEIRIRKSINTNYFKFYVAK